MHLQRILQFFINLDVNLARVLISQVRILIFDFVSNFRLSLSFSISFMFTILASTSVTFCATYDENLFVSSALFKVQLCVANAAHKITINLIN
jgi:hypothetical protein